MPYSPEDIITYENVEHGAGKAYKLVSTLNYSGDNSTEVYESFSNAVGFSADVFTYLGVSASAITSLNEIIESYKNDDTTKIGQGGYLKMVSSATSKTIYIVNEEAFNEFVNIYCTACDQNPEIAALYESNTIVNVLNTIEPDEIPD